MNSELVILNRIPNTTRLRYCGNTFEEHEWSNTDILVSLWDHFINLDLVAEGIYQSCKGVS